ncbi:heparinase II/III-family protein [Parapedobacter tibetensis]|uniref:heparinase II/III-family protein n=1 Tax=Parapedobacter tibetensis TaxID=2972951 RepID=UPI00214DB115|nr:heparinase II/III-family protein [Parapedobacter tibetensis]
MKQNFTKVLAAIVLALYTLEATGQSPTDISIPPFVNVAPKAPQFPLKTDRLLYTDEEIEQARNNIKQDATAKSVADKIVSAAGYWLDWQDQDIVDLMTDARVPRAFDLNANGCPIHGAEVFAKGGAYPWIVDPKKPFQVKSPIDGRVFPDNDYAAYYKSGLKEKKGWDAKYVDDGWGWVAPDGERYWFVAYANHWIWHRHIIPGIGNLSKAYLLTGDKKYAYKAVLMLHRLAEVYPSMNHEDQSRYGLMTRARGGVYRGKIINAIWETATASVAAAAYDAVWDAIDDLPDLHTSLNKSGIEIRSYIEANFVENALLAYEQNKILGNFGMHQAAVLNLIIARQYAEPERYLNHLLDDAGQNRSKMGLRYALYNQVFRDGLPLESLQYNFLWIRYLTKIADLLKKKGVDLFDEPRFRMLLDGPIHSVAIGKYTPALGDGSDVLGGITGRSAETYQSAYHAYQDERYLSWLEPADARGFPSFESLFRSASPAKKQQNNDVRVVQPLPSRVFAGYGLGILNDPEDDVALALKYGMHYAHYHWDFLNIELMANGQKMMPDLGYPDAMNNYVKGIATWSTNTISHNTVVVNASRQTQNIPGRLHHFADGTFARNMDAESGAYRQASQYRRNVVMVAANDQQHYVVDFFHVQGGKQHDYSLHGPPGEVLPVEGVWSEKQPGTLAGTDVSLGEIYDNRLLDTAGERIGYRRYVGSGYQHLFHVQQLRQGNALVEYQHVLDSNARLRLHMLPAEHQEVFLADAYDKPRAKNHVVKYMIARRANLAPEKSASTFSAVFETYKTKPYIRSVEHHPLTTGSGASVRVVRNGFSDVIICDTVGSEKELRQYGIQTDANTAVVTFDDKGKLTRVYFSDGTYLKCKGQSFVRKPLRGEVQAVDIAANRVTMTFPRGTDLKSMGGQSVRTVHFTNGHRTTVHPASLQVAVDGQASLHTTDDLRMGYFGVAQVKGNALTTDTELNFYHHYRGSTLVNKDLEPVGMIVSAEKQKLTLDKDVSGKVRKADKLWVSDVGVGDKVTIKTVFSWSRK